ncbi:MAG: hypothetical protein Q9228_004566 [Teloschistes exilis]
MPPHPIKTPIQRIPTRRGPRKPPTQPSISLLISRNKPSTPNSLVLPQRRHHLHQSIKRPIIIDCQQRLRPQKYHAPQTQNLFICVRHILLHDFYEPSKGAESDDVAVSDADVQPFVCVVEGRVFDVANDGFAEVCEKGFSVESEAAGMIEMVVSRILGGMRMAEIVAVVLVLI